MAVMIPASRGFVNDIINRFDELYYPTVPVERVTDRPSDTDQELVQGSSRLPRVLQVMVYDYAPNISNWILSTGVLQRGNKDDETKKSIEESAAERLKSFGRVPLPNVSNMLQLMPNTRQLMGYVFSTAIQNMHPLAKKQFLSTILWNSKRAVVTGLLWSALFKIESILIRCGIGLAIISAFVIPLIEYGGIVLLGVKLLEAMVITSPLAAIVGSVVVIATALVTAGISLAFFTRRLRPHTLRWDASLRQFDNRNQEKLLERQKAKATEIWTNLLLGQLARAR